MKKVTTSAQKTVGCTMQQAFELLKKKLEDDQHIIFTSTDSPLLNKALLPDGSEITVAAFKKDNGKTLAMIDHKNVDQSKRNQRQVYWRTFLDDLFKN